MKSPLRPRLRHLALATAIACTAPHGFSVHAQEAPATADQRRYAVPAGPLDVVLNQFARQAGVLLSYDPAAVQGLHSNGLSGQASVQGGLDLLLQDHPLGATSAGSNSWVIQPAVRKRTVRTQPIEGAAHGVKLPDVTVTAQSDVRQQVFETAGSVAVVTRDEIDRLPPRNAGDLLAEVPGVYASQSRTDPGLAVNIRGLQDFGRVNVMIDGTRQNYQQSGHGANGTVYLDPELLAGVDITKGPASTVGGAGMIAGMVNFRTLEVDDLVREGATHGARLNTTSGSNAYHFAGSAALGLKPREDIDLVMVASRKSVGEFEKGQHGSVNGRINNVVHGVTKLSSQDQTSLLLKGTWRPTAAQSIKLSYIGLDAKFGEEPQTATAGGIQNHVRSDTVVLNHHWKPQEQRAIDLKSSLYVTRTRNQAQRFAGGELDANAYALEYQTRTVGGAIENTARMDWNGTGLVLKAGGEFYQDKTLPKSQALSVGADAGTTALFTGPTPAGERTVASVFGEASVLPTDWLEVTGGLRYDWYGMQGEGRMRVGSIVNPPGVRPGTTTVYTRFQTDRNDGAFAPRLSVSLRPTESLQFFASIARGMRPPALTEALMWGQHTGGLFPYYPNPNLKAERSRQWELGVNGIFKNVLTERDTARFKLAWFDNKVRDYVTMARIMSPIDTEGGGIFGPYAYVNLDGPFHSRGVELQSDIDTGTAFATLNFTRMLMDTGGGGYDPFPLGSLTGYPANNLGRSGGDANIWYVLPPRRTASLSGGLRLLERRLTLGARVRLQWPTTATSVWTAQSNSYNQKSWRLYDLWASHEVNKHLTVRLAVNNVFDINYAEMQGGSYFMGPGRTAMATLSLSF